ncbi:response regulator [Patescibacteria group bacterium]|nr:response regulator [Patescibacteria group bacterium]
MNNINKKIKILLVDDDEFIQIFFKDVFWVHDHNKDYEVLVAHDLKEAKKIIDDSKTKPNIVFLDLVLVKNDVKGQFVFDDNESLKLLKALKSDTKTKDIVIVIFSGYSDKSLIKKAMEMGADEYLVKGEFLPQDLIKITENILSKTKKS